jgi:hypothetical protein
LSAVLLSGRSIDNRTGREGFIEEVGTVLLDTIGNLIRFVFLYIVSIVVLSLLIFYMQVVGAIIFGCLITGMFCLLIADKWIDELYENRINETRSLITNMQK